MNPRVVGRWPRVRRIKRRGGVGVRVSGWVSIDWRVRVLRIAVALVIFLSGATLLLCGVAPVFSNYPETREIAEPFVHCQHQLASFVYRFKPDWVRWLDIREGGASRTMLITGGVIWLLGKPLTFVLSRTIGFFVPLTIKRPFRVVIKPGLVTIHHPLWRRRFAREPGVPIQFMCDSLPQRYPHDTPLMKLSMRYGFREVVLVKGINQKDGDRMSGAMNYAIGACAARTAGSGVKSGGAVGSSLDNPLDIMGGSQPA